ncbi:PREDICTED: uncharacterized protein LOC109487732 isoform X2 [Branchiostoma belcheri]|uniref:Uncharacterized protein LOC109487732 isoform X2 n=1 Tax=Branchiostoma belcheri TaxID=7741 RepID=A0A6P5AYY8_BRABE|nr:PREDICTED: uncharacterized protein LOC109487732 isoform X2 [Branchiostoma belcheri]
MGSSLEQAALLLILLPLLTGHTHAQTTAASSPLPDLASPSQPVDTSPQDAEDTTQLQATTEFYSSEASATETQPGAPSASGTATDPGIQAVTTASEAVAADNVTVLAAGATTTVLAATTEAGSTVARTATEQQVADNDTTAAPVAVGVSTVTSGPSVVDTSTVQMMATTEEVLETGFEDLVPGTDEQPDSSGVTKMPETTTTPPPVVVMGNTTVASTAVPGNVTENATRAAFLPFIPRTTSRPVVSTRASTEEPAVSTTLRLTTQSVPRTTTEDLSRLIPSKNQADLSNEESDNIVTVFFNGTRSKLTRNSWILQYDETFREDLSEIINDISAGLNVQPTDVIYVEPTPKLRREGLLEVSIFVYNRTSRTDNKLEKRDADQSTVSKDVVEAALNQMKDQYEQQDRDVEIVEVSPGLTAPQPALPTRQTSIFGEYFSLFIALIVIACVCVVIILLGVLYLCVRKKKGKLRDHEKVIVDDGLRLDSYQALDNPGATFTDDEILTGQNGKPKAEEAWTVKPSAPPPPNGRIAENTEEEDTHL